MLINKNYRFLAIFSLFTFGLVHAALAEGPTLPAGTGAAVTSPASPGGSAQAAAPNQPGFFGMIAPFLIMFAVLYFLVMRPQQKRMKEQAEMLKNLQSGDEIVFGGGILGKITGIAEKVVTVELDDRVRAKVLKSSVSQVIKGPIKDQVNS